MNGKTTLATLTGLFCLGSAMSVYATQLSELHLESQPGQAFEAYVDVVDLDLNKGSIYVRIGNPELYRALGQPRPDFLNQFKLVPVKDSNPVRLRIVSSEPVPAEAFPLLMQLSVGDERQIQEYRLTPGPKGWRLSTKAVPLDKDGAPRLTGAQHVKAYVDKHGFNPNEPFKVTADMTLWSIAQLYYPRYEGATLDQLVVALKAANPEAFQKGAGFRLVDGATLTPPSTEAVFATDPKKAFVEVHGEKATLPGITHNLIKAQEISPALAQKVAQAQARLLKAGRSEATVIEAGASVIAGEQGDAAKTTPLGNDTPNRAESATGTSDESITDLPAGAAKEVLTQAPNGEAKETQEIPPTQGVDAHEVEVPAEPQGKPVFNDLPDNVRPLKDVMKEKEREQKAKAESEGALATTPAAVATEAKTAPVANETAGEKTSSEASANGAASEKDTLNVKGSQSLVGDGAVSDKTTASTEAMTKPSMTGHIRFDDPNARQAQGDIADLLSMKDRPWWWLILIPILIGILWRTLRKVNERPKTPSVAGEVQAQAKAKAEGESCEDGCGSKGPQTVKLDKHPSKMNDAQKAAVEATVNECVKNGTTAGAMGVGAMAYTQARMESDKAQPWLDSTSDELPPLDDGEASKTDSQTLAKTATVMEGLSLDLTDGKNEPTPQVVKLSQGEKGADAESAEAINVAQTLEANAPKTAKVNGRELSGKSLSMHEQAQYKAIDAKLKLAQTFVEQGAHQEALELLDEVKRRGSAEQKALAKRLTQTLS